MTTEYRIYSGVTPIILEESVKDKLRDGWKLCGGPFHVPGKWGGRYYQAMTHEEDETVGPYD